MFINIFFREDESNKLNNVLVKFDRKYYISKTFINIVDSNITTRLKLDVNSVTKLRKVSQISTLIHTVCPRSSDPFYIVSYYIIWVTTSWTYSSSLVDSNGPK